MALAESPIGVASFHLTLSVDGKGEGTGKLLLSPNLPVYNEFGDEVGLDTKLPHVVLNCAVKLVKQQKVKSGPPRFEEYDRYLYSLKGKKITTPLSLVTTGRGFHSALLLVGDRAGKVKSVVPLTRVPPPEPCHPGCFPAGTLVQTPRGARRIEEVRVGDAVTTVGPAGEVGVGKVQSVFVTRNRLVRVETEAGELFTTLTQPLCLAGGGVRAASELRAGDRVLRWQGGKRQAVHVRRATITEREEAVFNLVLGGEEVFVAGDYLARSKPPAEGAPSGASE